MTCPIEGCNAKGPIEAIAGHFIGNSIADLPYAEDDGHIDHAEYNVAIVLRHLEQIGDEDMKHWWRFGL